MLTAFNYSLQLPRFVMKQECAQDCLSVRHIDLPFWGGEGGLILGTIESLPLPLRVKVKTFKVAVFRCQ